MRGASVGFILLALAGFGAVYALRSHHPAATGVAFNVPAHRAFTLHPNAATPAGYGAAATTPTAATEAVPAGSLGACATMLPHGQAPTYDNTRYSQQAMLVCHRTMVYLASGLTRTALWSAEYLDAARVQAARTMQRTNSFHPDAQLPASARAELADYTRSGYDRGHLSPSGDQPDAAAQNDSFSLANMAPQNPGFNRGPWERLEEAVRNRALRSPLYVITGVLFEGQTVGFLKQRVAVPSMFYKVVYDPTQQQAAVFWGPNTDGATVTASPVAGFEQAKGIHFNLGSVTDLQLTIASGSRFSPSD